MRERTVAVKAAIGLAALALGALPAAAQPWAGMAALGIEVRAEGAGPVAGVELRLKPMAIATREVPRPATTGPDGRAVVAGLAPGLWQVDLAKEGYAATQIYVRLEDGKKAAIVGNPTRDADGTPFKLEFFKVKRGEVPLPPPVPAPRPAEPPPPAVQAPPPAIPPAPKAPPPAAEVQPGPPASPPAAPKAEEPGREKAPPPPPAPVVKPTPPASPPVKTTPPPAPPAAVPPPTQPPATPPPAAVPSPPAPPAAVPQEILSMVRSASVGNCADCKKGEAAVTVEQSAGPAGPACAAGAAEAVPAAVAALAGDLYAGAPAQGGAAAAALAPYTAAGAPCQLVAVALPAGSRFTGYLYEAGDEMASGGCNGDQPCEIGTAAWSGHPTVDKAPGGATLVWAVFTNTSPERARRARMTVYFATGK